MSHLQMQASAGRQRMLCAVGCVAHCLAGALKQPTGQELYDQARGIYIKQKHWYQSKVGQPGSQAARQPGTSILHQATPTGWMGLRAPPNRKPTRLLPWCSWQAAWCARCTCPGLLRPCCALFIIAVGYALQAEAVIAVLEDKEEDEKVLIFSEYPNTLRAIKALLPEIGLQSRNLIGGSGAGAHAVLGDSTVAVAVAMAVVSALTAAVQNACG